MTKLDDWKLWRDERVVAARAPHGPLALTGTYWLADLASGARRGVPGVPGRWELADGGTCVTLTAAAHDGLAVNDVPLDGTVRLCPDTAPSPSRITHGGRLLVLILREGEFAVRLFDPASEARAAFAGIDTHPYDPDWELAASFTAEQPHTVRVPNADGRERGLHLAGTVSFEVDGVPRTLRVSRNDDGSLHAVFADRAHDRFRFVDLPAEGPDGRTTLDFNHAYLPPCSFADHFICPFPPPGNRLELPVPAGESHVLQH